MFQRSTRRARKSVSCRIESKEFIGFISVQRAGRDEPSGMSIKGVKPLGIVGGSDCTDFSVVILLYIDLKENDVSLPLDSGYYAPTNFLSANVFFRNTLTALVFRRKMGGGSCPDLFSCTDY